MKKIAAAILVPLAVMTVGICVTMYNTRGNAGNEKADTQEVFDTLNLAMPSFNKAECQQTMSLKV